MSRLLSLLSGGLEVEINILDAAHGFCAYIVADNRNVILIDCGKNEETGFEPSRYLAGRGCRVVELFIVSNYDEDHLSDLPNLRNKIRIERLLRNKSISGDELRRLKLEAGPLGPGMEALLGMIGNYITTPAQPIDFDGIERKTFYNEFPTFPDTNNLSVVTFLHYLGTHIVFPGDLEKAGWLALLEQSEFQRELEKTNFLVASHHGRESGYCEEVFGYCQPNLVIVSDEDVKYDTQKTPYRKHATGVPWSDGTTRYVLTTRNDGKITISQMPGEKIKVTTAL
jgi:beta-lactamase superfamily II metal-dependent hydrolase